MSSAAPSCAPLECPAVREVWCAVALEQPACVLAKDAVIDAVARRTTQSIQPYRLVVRLSALRLSAEALKELWKGHAVLALDLVEVRDSLQAPQPNSSQSEPGLGGFPIKSSYLDRLEFYFLLTQFGVRGSTKSDTGSTRSIAF